MRLLKQGHACVVVEVEDVHILIDPGRYTELTFDGELSAICITHGHGDHFDPALVETLVQQHGAAVYAEAGVANTLAGIGCAATAVAPADEFKVSSLRVEVLGGRHAVIHEDLPASGNVAFLIGGTFLHPGDSLDVVDDRIRALALPTVGPWLATADAIDYLRRVVPQIALPIHDGIASQPGMFAKYAADLAPAGTTVATHEPGTWVTVP